MRITRVGLGLALVSMSCAFNPPPVLVEGTPGEVATLTGEWVGEYHSVETGRSGSIWFKLDAGRDTAFGDVVMIPAGSAAPQYPPTMSDASAQMRRSQALSIHFVSVAGNRVIGTIDLYPSPDCECELLTRFEGELRGDRIAGAFTTQHSGHQMAPQKGTWWVKRKTP